MNDVADRFQRLASRLGANPSVFSPNVLIEKAKASIDRDLPTEYIAWILYCGECKLDEQLGIEFITVSHPIDGPLRDIRSEMPLVFELGIPIATDSFGNYFVLLDCHERRPVVFAEGTSAYEASCVVASSLERFLIMVCESIATRNSDWWLSKEFVLSHDPDVSSFADIPMPWEDEN